jgi:Flp pilus assembly protein TadG
MMSSEALEMKRRGMKLRGNESGSVAVIVAIALPVFLAFAALAIDLSHLYVARNELQNAADAGALAGARFLYNDSGTSVNETANQTAKDAAVANNSEKLAVEVQWESGNEGDVQRGHWSFGLGALARGFYPNASTAPVALWDLSTRELDENTDFINAVRVVARRQNTPVSYIFATIWGNMSKTMSAEAVAYIGFAGTLEPKNVDQPIAICKESIIDAEGNYTCGVGRMINSGSNVGHQTGGWTNFTQDPCETASTPTIKPLVCANGNPNIITFGEGMGTTGGMVQAAYDQLLSCWLNNSGLDTDGDKWPDKPWNMTLPVILCPDNNTGNCATVVGAVELKVIWITRNDKNQMLEVPRKMGDWTCPSGYTPAQCWSDFVVNFGLKDVLNNTEAIYEDKTIYFIPDCTYHEPKGVSGGENFGILAKIPVLVK